jgi:hypothetical protein
VAVQASPGDPGRSVRSTVSGWNCSVPGTPGASPRRCPAAARCPRRSSPRCPADAAMAARGSGRRPPVQCRWHRAASGPRSRRRPPGAVLLSCLGRRPAGDGDLLLGGEPGSSSSSIRSRSGGGIVSVPFAVVMNRIWTGRRVRPGSGP